MDLDQDHIDDVGTQLTVRLGYALRNKEVTEDQVSEIAEFVLSRLQAVKTQPELIVFLQEIAQKWPIFSDYLTLERSRTLAKEEEVTVRRVEELIKQKNFDAALQVAKNAPTMGGSK